MKKTLVSLLITLLLCSIGYGVTVSIPVDADSDVRQGAPDYAKGDRPWHYLCNTSTNSGKIYLRFNLPADFGTAVSANLKMYCGAVLSTSYGADVNVHGVLDSVAGQNWTEIHSLTWNNAPANDTSSGMGFTSDATGVLGTFFMTGGRYGGVVGEEYNVSTPELVSFLNDDSDKVITFAIGRVSISSAWHGIAAKEMGSQPGPVLELTYDPIPEPATLTLLALGGAALIRRK